MWILFLDSHFIPYFIRKTLICTFNLQYISMTIAYMFFPTSRAASGENRLRAFGFLLIKFRILDIFPLDANTSAQGTRSLMLHSFISPLARCWVETTIICTSSKLLHRLVPYFRTKYSSYVISYLFPPDYVLGIRDIRNDVLNLCLMTSELIVTDRLLLPRVQSACAKTTRYTHLERGGGGGLSE